MEENRIFDLVLVKYGRFLVNCSHILVKCGRFLEIFGIDVITVTPRAKQASGRGPEAPPGFRTPRCHTSNFFGGVVFFGACL